VASANLAVSINWQMPGNLAAVLQSEVVIKSGFPATVRVPDVVVTSASRYRQNPPRFDAGDVLLAVEIISPGSGTTDRITKLGEYAEAGIPHYWLIDLKQPATLTVDVSRLADRQY
jgi:Uma2 family endonuclease